MKRVLQSTFLAVALLTSPLVLKSEAHLPAPSSDQLVVTPIIIDHLITVVCDNSMNHIWITNAAGVVVAESEGVLGLVHVMNLTAQPAGNYHLTVSTSAGPASSSFTLR